MTGWGPLAPTAEHPECPITPPHCTNEKVRLRVRKRCWREGALTCASPSSFRCCECGAWGLEHRPSVGPQHRAGGGGKEPAFYTEQQHVIETTLPESDVTCILRVVCTQACMESWTHYDTYLCANPCMCECDARMHAHMWDSHASIPDCTSHA